MNKKRLLKIVVVATRTDRASLEALFINVLQSILKPWGVYIEGIGVSNISLSTHYNRKETHNEKQTRSTRPHHQQG